jgi:hypothetical protein
MRVNIFSGARRIALVVAIAATAGASLLAWNVNEPYLSMTYSIDVFGSVAQPSTGCGADDGRKYFRALSSAKHDVSIDLCFAPTIVSSGASMIAYRKSKDHEGYLDVDNKWSPGVTAYMDSVARAFELPADAAEKADDEWRQQSNEQIKWTLVTAAVAAFSVWLATKIIGWIVRGFLAIPMGNDFRES